MSHVHFKNNLMNCDYCGDTSKLPSKTAKELMGWMDEYEKRHGLCPVPRHYVITRHNVEAFLANARAAFEHKKTTAMDHKFDRYLDDTFGSVVRVENAKE